MQAILLHNIFVPKPMMVGLSADNYLKVDLIYRLTINQGKKSFGLWHELFFEGA